MLQENYSHYARHKRAHEHLLDSVSDVRRKFDAGDIDAVRRYCGRPDELVRDPRVIRGRRAGRIPQGQSPRECGSGDRRYAVGVPSIDALHEECAALVRKHWRTRWRAAADVQDALDALHEHLVQAFRARGVADGGDSIFRRRRATSASMPSVLEVVAEVQKRYAAGDREPAARLDAAILEWFELHAGSMDAMLAQWLHAPRAASLHVEPSL